MTEKFLRTHSHRAREGLDRVLGYHPQYWFTFDHGGCFVQLHGKEREKALKIKGITETRIVPAGKCWETGYPKR